MTQKIDEEPKRQFGFTIYELIIAIVVIGILAGVGNNFYNGVQSQLRNVQRMADIKMVQRRLVEYYRENGEYPVTSTSPSSNWKTVDVLTDKNCFNGSKQIDWVPGFTKLPQSVPNTGSDVGADGKSGCYLYASDGKEYVLSAWNMINPPSSTKQFYRRLGFRSFQTSTSTQFYTCNANEIGGKSGSSYDINNDYYKHSYTFSNIKNCDETPPAGA